MNNKFHNQIIWHCFIRVCP